MTHKMLTALLAAVFVIAGSITAFASSTAGWKWIDGYCYYFTDKDCRNKLTDTATPDGYTVDAQGRWTVNGVPQYNGYGTAVIGTDALYAGKDDVELWNTMKPLLVNLYQEKWFGIPEPEFATKSYNIWVSSDENHKYPDYYICIFLSNYWNDSPEYYESNRSEVIEQTLKIVCGDHAGQELFNALRAAAEPAGGGPKQIAKKDANGNSIRYYDEYGMMKRQVEEVSTSGDGVNFALMDLNAWNGRKTDYGKTIYIEPGYMHWDNASETPSDYRIIIK